MTTSLLADQSWTVCTCRLAVIGTTACTAAGWTNANRIAISRCTIRNRDCLGHDVYARCCVPAARRKPMDADRDASTTRRRARRCSGCVHSRASSLARQAGSFPLLSETHAMDGACRYCGRGRCHPARSAKAVRRQAARRRERRASDYARRGGLIVGRIVSSFEGDALLHVGFRATCNRWANVLEVDACWRA